uniref:LD01463p n=1 Tax=Drosophila melanogaster TaxID=7227 RepID=Q95RY1_DROME|nr:LD01463p [Drosophila melanogaster]
MQIAQIVYALSFTPRFDFVILLYILKLICSSPSSVSHCVCECVRRHALVLVLSLSRTCSAVCSLLCFFSFRPIPQSTFHF